MDLLLFQNHLSIHFQCFSDNVEQQNIMPVEG